MSNTWPFTRKQWLAIPLDLRQRWWAETNYSSLKPSPELRSAVEQALRACGALNLRIDDPNIIVPGKDLTNVFPEES